MKYEITLKIMNDIEILELTQMLANRLIWQQRYEIALRSRNYMRWMEPEMCTKDIVADMATIFMNEITDTYRKYTN